MNRKEKRQRLAQMVVERSLEMPVVFFLELHKPILSMIPLCSAFIAPIAAPFFGLDRFYSFLDILSEPAEVEKLIREIEHLSSLKQRDKNSILHTDSSSVKMG